MTLADLVIKSYDQTLTREQRGEYYRQAVEMAQKEVSKPKRAKKTDTLEGFDEWYKHYPHKVARGYAEKAYAHARGIATQEQLIKGANWYSRNKPEETPWAHPASWLNAKRWLDGQEDSVIGIPTSENFPEWKQKIAEKIGEAKTSTWFRDVEYTYAPASGNSGYDTKYNNHFMAPKPAYNWIKDHYMNELNAIFGNVELSIK
jgi:hypothetical protein